MLEGYSFHYLRMEGEDILMVSILDDVLFCWFGFGLVVWFVFEFVRLFVDGKERLDRGRRRSL